MVSLPVTPNTMKYYTSRQWESDSSLFRSLFLSEICSIKWCYLQHIIVTLSSTPILRRLRHSFYGRSSSAAIISSSRGFISQSFVLKASVVSYSFFEKSSSTAIVSSPRGFLSPYFILRTSVVSYVFHEQSSSAAIVSPFIVRFTNELCYDPHHLPY